MLPFLTLHYIFSKKMDKLKDNRQRVYSAMPWQMKKPKLKHVEKLNAEEEIIFEEQAPLAAEVFECIICFTYRRDFLICFPGKAGHVVCKSCYRAMNSNSTCPMKCGATSFISPSQFTRAIFGAVFRYAQIACRFRRHGCPFRGSVWDELKQHEKNCIYQLVQCCSCYRHTSFWDILKHKECFKFIKSSRANICTWKTSASIPFDSKTLFFLKPFDYVNKNYFFPKLVLSVSCHEKKQQLAFQLDWLETENVARYHRREQIKVQVTVSCCRMSKPKMQIVFYGIPTFQTDKNRCKNRPQDFVVHFDQIKQLAMQNKCLSIEENQKIFRVPITVKLLKGGKIKKIQRLRFYFLFRSS